MVFRRNHWYHHYCIRNSAGLADVTYVEALSQSVLKFTIELKMNEKHNNSFTHMDLLTESIAKVLTFSCSQLRLKGRYRPLRRDLNVLLKDKSLLHIYSEDRGWGLSTASSLRTVLVVNHDYSMETRNWAESLFPHRYFSVQRIVLAAPAGTWPSQPHARRQSTLLKQSSGRVFRYDF